jgi:hypothetical protein
MEEGGPQQKQGLNSGGPQQKQGLNSGGPQQKQGLNSGADPNKNRGWAQVLRKGRQIKFYKEHKKETGIELSTLQVINTDYIRSRSQRPHVFLNAYSCH